MTPETDKEDGPDKAVRARVRPVLLRGSHVKKSLGCFYISLVNEKGTLAEALPGSMEPTSGCPRAFGAGRLRALARPCPLRWQTLGAFA